MATVDKMRRVRLLPGSGEIHPGVPYPKRSHLGQEQVPVDKAGDKMIEIFVSGKLLGGVGAGCGEH